MAVSVTNEAGLQACYLDLTQDYTVANDIAMTANFKAYMIGKTYAKTFDGGGFTISNFVIDALSANENGLFKGLAGSGVIKNVIIASGGCDFDGTYIQNGVICGNNAGTIQDCTVSGDMNFNDDTSGCICGNNTGTISRCTYKTGTATTTNANANTVGGIVGSTAGTVTDCIVESDAVLDFDLSTLGRLGGIAGNIGNNNLAMSGCLFYGAIDGTQAVGGIIGYFYDTVTGVALTNNHSRGVRVTGTGNYLGGFIGYSRGTGTYTNCSSSAPVTQKTNSTAYNGGFAGEFARGTITRCYATGNVSLAGTGCTYAGGFLGRGVISGSCTDCWASGNVTGGSYSGGFVGGLGIVCTNCHATGNVDGMKSLGGFCGNGGGGSCYQCFATGNVTPLVDNNSNYTGFGGFIGETYGATGTFDNCFATGDVGSASYRPYQWAGGFGGYFNQLAKRCWASGNVWFSYQNAGGFIGRSVTAAGKCYDCFAVGTIAGGAATYAGEFCGTNSGTISNCGCIEQAGYRAIGSPAGDVTYMETTPYPYIGNETHGVFTAGTYPWDFTTPIWTVHPRNFPQLEQRRIA